TRTDASWASSRLSCPSASSSYSCGMPPSPPRNMTLSFPSASSPSFNARIDPSASPSGFSCVTRRKRSRSRRASATAVSSFVGGELIDQLRHPHPPLNRLIVLEGQLGSPLHSELARDARLQNAVRRGEARERRLALAFRP